MLYTISINTTFANSAFIKLWLAVKRSTINQYFAIAVN
jgi:hypothetical protein